MVKCIECGFLAVRDGHNSQLVCEATEKCRASGYHHNSNDTSSPAQFFCYLGRPEFPPVADSAPTGSSVVSPRREMRLETDRVELLKTEIPCDDAFCRWRHGKSPKEHEEMTFLQRVEAERQADSSRMTKWREEDLSWQKQVRRDGWIVCGIAAVVGVVGGAAGGPVIEWLRDWWFSAPPLMP